MKHIEKIRLDRATRIATLTNTHEDIQARRHDALIERDKKIKRDKKGKTK